MNRLENLNCIWVVYVQNEGVALLKECNTYRLSSSFDELRFRSVVCCCAAYSNLKELTSDFSYRAYETPDGRDKMLREISEIRARMREVESILNVLPLKLSLSVEGNVLDNGERSFCKAHICGTKEPYRSEDLS